VILGQNGIRNAHDRGLIKISPFRPDQLNPGSYDVRLKPTLLINRLASARHHRRWWLPSFWTHTIDPALDYYYEELTIPESGIVLYPGITYLGGTEEVVGTGDFIACYDGKSSAGRLGIFSHVTAGYIDNGFLGQVTLEFVVVQPTVLYPRMRIGQIRFHQIVDPGESYRDVGSYTDGGCLPDHAHVAPTPSRMYRQLRRDNIGRRA
jgi:dCTP deaminase